MNATENEMFPQETSLPEEQGSDAGKMADEIKALQKEIGVTKKTPSNSKMYNDFNDDYGNETWYIKNNTNFHVVLDIEEMDKIAKNLTVDLLAMADLESVKNSKALRRCINDGTLKRITPSEFLAHLREEKSKKKRADEIVAKETGKDTEEEIKVRNVVITKVEKYKMYINSVNKDQGMSTVEFVSWLTTEKLNTEELEYCLSGIVDNDIRTLLITKRQELVQGA